jgi:hypothetical protein
MKKLALLAVTALAATALANASSASATVLCKTAPANHVCPVLDKYGVGTKITWKLKSNFTMKNGFTTIECTGGTLSSSIFDAGSENTRVQAEISDLSFSGCGVASVSVLNMGTVSIGWTSGTDDGTLKTEKNPVTGKQTEIKLKAGTTECVYGGEITENITVTGGSSPIVRLLNAPVPKLAGGILCANPAKWAGEYEITSPTPLYVEQK